MLAPNHEEVLMRKQQNIVRTIFAVLVALITLASAVSAQVRNTWSSRGPNLATTSLAIDPVNAETIYAGTGAGVFKSTDNGATWQRTSLSGDVIALIADSARPNVLYAAIAERGGCFHSDRRLFKSTDGGASWSAGVSPPINGCDNIHALVMDPTDPNRLYLANYDDSVGDTWTPLIKSADGGATWAPLYGPPFATLAVDPLHPNTLFAGTVDFAYYGYDGWDYRHGVLKSIDGGAHWSTTGLTNTGVGVLAIDPLNPGTLYAATSGFTGYPIHPSGFQGLFKSTDAGASWFPINNGLSDLLSAQSAVTAIVIDRDNSNTLYAGTAGRGVFKTTDGGANWSSLNEGLTSLDVQALIKTPGASHSLYAATSGGVFTIDDNSAPPTINQIDDPQFFVRQQYRDFLNREPDTDGLAFWTN